MGLIDLKTNLKSLKFGKDKPGGGSSNQPYIQSDIPDKDGILPDSPDFLLRGGLKNPIDAATDIVRLGKYFIDLKSPSGLLFIAKQNLLSRNAVRTEASGVLNEFIYTPLSTLAQAGVNGIGFHFNKQGLNPIPGTPGSIRTYENSINTREFFNTETDLNRLVSLYRVKVIGTHDISTVNGITSIKADTINLLEYPGGPGSILGIGKTRFKFSSTVPTINNQGKNITGENQLQETNRDDIDFEYKVSEPKFGTVPEFIKNRRNSGKTLIKEPLGTSFKYDDLFRTHLDKELQKEDQGPGKKYFSTKTNKLPGTNGSIFTSGEHPTGSSGFTYSSRIKRDIQNPLILSTLYDKYTSNFVNGGSISLSAIKSNPFSQGSNWHYVNEGKARTVFGYVDNKIQTATINESVEGAYTYTYEELLKGKDYSNLSIGIQDFRKQIRNRTSTLDDIYKTKVNNLVPNSPDYTLKNIENRVELGDPGKPFGKNLESYVEGYNGAGAAASGSYDRITTKQLYYSGEPDKDNVNDLVKFRIAAIDNDPPFGKVYIHFRAFLNNISDTYSADWNSEKYVGRGENFYNYSGFDRKVSLSFTVAAQSKIELIPMYKKLNYLASQLAPDYSKNGYMRGPLVSLTIGGYFYEQPGFITGLSYDMPEDSSWEIGINTDGESDPTVKELSHIIKVSNFSFTPIHDFVPRKADHKNLGATPFIALSNGITNYNDAWPTI